MANSAQDKSDPCREDFDIRKNSESISRMKIDNEKDRQQVLEWQVAGHNGGSIE